MDTPAEAGSSSAAAEDEDAAIYLNGLFSGNISDVARIAALKAIKTRLYKPSDIKIYMDKLYDSGGDFIYCSLPEASIITETVLFYTGRMNKVPHILISPFESDSLISECERLEDLKILQYSILPITYPIESGGIFDLKQIRSCMKTNTILICISQGKLGKHSNLYDLIDKLNKNRKYKIPFHSNISDLSIAQEYYPRGVGIASFYVNFSTYFGYDCGMLAIHKGLYDSYEFNMPNYFDTLCPQIYASLVSRKELQPHFSANCEKFVYYIREQIRSNCITCSYEKYGKRIDKVAEVIGKGLNVVILFEPPTAKDIMFAVVQSLPDNYDNLPDIIDEFAALRPSFILGKPSAIFAESIGLPPELYPGFAYISLSYEIVRDNGPEVCEYINIFIREFVKRYGKKRE